MSSNNNETIQVDGNETIQVDEDGSDDDSDTDTDHHDDALDTDDSVYSPSTASYDSDSDSDSTITLDEQKNCDEKTDAILQNIKTAGIRAKRSDFIDRQPLKDCFHSDSCPHIQIDMNSKTIYHTLDAIDPSIVHDCKQRLLTVSREVLYETWFLTNRERLNLPFMGKKTFYNCFCKCMVTDTERKCVDTTETTFYSFLDTMKKLHTKPEVRACGCPFHLSVDEVPSAADK